jgi:hypothetical protein
MSMSSRMVRRLGRYDSATALTGTSRSSAHSTASASMISQSDRVRRRVVEHRACAHHIDG